MSIAIQVWSIDTIESKAVLNYKRNLNQQTKGL